MLINCMDFYETENAFLSNIVDIKKLDFANRKLVVKAHEKEIYYLNDNIMQAVIHRDNDGLYPFSKVDFLSHKLQELIFPQHMPKVYCADFSNQYLPYFIIQKIKLDKFHIACNIQKQLIHQHEGKKYYFSSDFLSLDNSYNINKLANEHYDRITSMQSKYEHLLSKYGIAFDHSSVNIVWGNDKTPISLEIHKCRRDYLFSYDICYKYFNRLNLNNSIKNNGLRILKRIKVLL